MCPFCKKKCVTLLWHHELLVSIFVIRTFFLLKLKLLTRKKYCPLAPCKLLTAENVAFTLCHDVLRGNIRWWPTNSQQARTHYIYMHIASWFQPQLLYSEHFRSNELAWLCKLIAAVMCHLCYTQATKLQLLAWSSSNNAHFWRSLLYFFANEISSPHFLLLLLLSPLYCSISWLWKLF